MFRTVLTSLLAVLVLCGSAFAAEKTLIAAANPTWPPMEFLDENKNIIGYDRDIITAIAEEIGMKSEFRNIAWDGIFASLESGQANVIASCVTITDKRKKAYVFSDPYYEVHQAVVVAKDSAIKKPEDLKGKKVAVVGGGNVAMDAARSALRMGAEHVYIVYRRSEAEMPARLEEVHHAKEEGVEFQNLCNPVEILGDENGRVNGLKCIRMELGEPDESGRRRPVAIPDSEFVLDVDTVIMAIGTSPNPLISGPTKGLDTVYAGGFAFTGASTFILAMGAGKTAAVSIDEVLRGKA